MNANDLYKKYSKSYMGYGVQNLKLESYHEYRLKTFSNLLLRNFKDPSVVDYGCGDGAIKKLIQFKNYIGIDPSDEMIALAHENYPGAKDNFVHGGLDDLASVAGGAPSGTILVCLNTLPYMNEHEVDTLFYIATQNRMAVVVSHTNELLDLVSVNRYTVEHRYRLLSNRGLDVYLEKFKDMLSFPDLPSKNSQLKVRFGIQDLNTSERDIIRKYRVDPFTWPDLIAKKYNLKVKDFQAVRIFALPPAVMESNNDAIKILHSEEFDFLSETYKKIFCSQFRVVFEPST